jgi:hypothetical protein
MEIVYGILILIGLIAFYVGFSILNAKTKAPEGCELPEDFSGCSGCSSSSCGVRKKPTAGKEQKND